MQEKGERDLEKSVNQKEKLQMYVQYKLQTIHQQQNSVQQFLNLSVNFHLNLRNNNHSSNIRAHVCLISGAHGVIFFWGLYFSFSCSYASSKCHELLNPWIRRGSDKN